MCSRGWCFGSVGVPGGSHGHQMSFGRPIGSSFGALWPLFLDSFGVLLTYFWGALGTCCPLCFEITGGLSFMVPQLYVQLPTSSNLKCRPTSSSLDRLCPLPWLWVLCVEKGDPCRLGIGLSPLLIHGCKWDCVLQVSWLLWAILAQVHPFGVPLSHWAMRGSIWESI